MSTFRPAILILGLALALAACSPSPSVVPSTVPSGTQAGLRPVTLLLGFQPDVQFAPFYLAQQDGLFADAGLDVTIEYSDDVIRLVADGQSEFGVADATDVMIARSSGIPIKYVSTLYGHFPVVLIGAPDTLPAEPSGLAGLRIGTPGRFGSSWHALLALLDAGGSTEADVAIRGYPQFNQVEGLLNGDVDVITGFRANEPLRLEAQGFDVALMTVDDFAPLPGPGIVVGDELLGADHEMVAAFASAVVTAQQQIANDPQSGVEAAIAAVPAIADDRETALAVLEATIEAWVPPVTGEIVLDVWEPGYDTMQRLGFIDGSVPVEEMYEETILAGAGSG
jgi:NitT/TauT family transport system substrate-binding protein